MRRQMTTKNIEHFRQLGIDPDKPFDRWTEEERHTLATEALKQVQALRDGRPEHAALLDELAMLIDLIIKRRLN